MCRSILKPFGRIEGSRRRHQFADRVLARQLPVLVMSIKSKLETSSTLAGCGKDEEQIGEVKGPKCLENQYTSDRNPELKNVVHSFRNLGKNWGNIGSVPPKGDAIRDAILFVDLLPENITKPQVSIAEDGEINFSWRSNDVYIDIGFFGDGMIDYYASVDSQRIDEDASLAFSGRSLPRNLVAAITVA